MPAADELTELRQRLDPQKLPRHVAVIMDGNGRWAKQRGKPRIAGHRAGVKSVRAVVEAAAELHLQALTLYAFSSENWRRPALEVNALMRLLVEYLKRELDELQEHNIRLHTIGRIAQLPKDVQEYLTITKNQTRNNSGLILTLALNYGGQNEILDAVKNVVYAVQTEHLDLEALTPEGFYQYLATAELPELDLMIRTSGEMRISNFLLWQIAYAELYIAKEFWPDFGQAQFYQALLEYQQRSRRFGRVQ